MREAFRRDNGVASGHNDDVREDLAIVALVPERVPAFELGIVVEVFGLARPELDVPWWYTLTVCAERPGQHDASTSGFGFHVNHGLEALANAHTVIVPGWSGEPSDELLAALPRDARYVSICSGAFLLAAAGLLDGREVATHWRYADRLARQYPRVRVNPDVLYVDDGDVLTSAGSAAGIDLCLHVVRADHGSAIANRVARRLAVPPHRDPGAGRPRDPAPPRRRPGAADRAARAQRGRRSDRAGDGVGAGATARA